MKKKKFLRSITLLLVCIFSLQMTAFAAGRDTVSPLTNEYITRTWATVERGGNGLLNIAFDITGKGKMTEIGATSAYLYEVTGDSSKIVATYSYLDEDYADMMGSNSTFHAGNLPYSGTPGHRYYATVFFRAGNSSGSGTTSYTTSTVVAW